MSIYTNGEARTRAEQLTRTQDFFKGSGLSVAEYREYVLKELRLDLLLLNKQFEAYVLDHLDDVASISRKIAHIETFTDAEILAPKT